MAASAREVIEGLKEEIRRLERRPARRPSAAPTGDPSVDALLPGGGFPRGAISEIVGSPASGKTALALSALAAAARGGALVAFLDGRRQLYPPAAAALGVDLARLLIVRPPRGCAGREEARTLLWAAEALLASGAFAAVVVDLALPREEAGARQEAMLRRVRAAADQGGAAGLWLAEPGARARVPAAIRLELTRDGEATHVRRVFDGGAAAPLRSSATLRWPRGESHAA